VSVYPSVCHVDVSKRPNLLSNFFIAWWPHHSSFRKIPTGPLTGAPNKGEVPKICDFQPVFQKYRQKYRILIPTLNTDTDPALFFYRLFLWPVVILPFTYPVFEYSIKYSSSKMLTRTALNVMALVNCVHKNKDFVAALGEATTNLWCSGSSSSTKDSMLFMFMK